MKGKEDLIAYIGNLGISQPAPMGSEAQFIVYK